MPEYSVKYQEDTCGVAKVQLEGLYYNIFCNFHRKEGLYQILVTGEQGTVNLGTCVPFEGGFGIRTKIPQKKLGQIQCFEITKKYGVQTGWIPLIIEEPVKTLSVICDARLVKEGDKIGLEILKSGSIANSDIVLDR